MWNGIGWYGFIGPTTSTTDISLHAPKQILQKENPKSLKVSLCDRAGKIVPGLGPTNKAKLDAEDGVQRGSCCKAKAQALESTEGSRGTLFEKAELLRPKDPQECTLHYINEHMASIHSTIN